jgi:hypothetical protein
MDLTFSYALDDFIDGYKHIHSCMHNKGESLYKTYAPQAIGIYLLRSAQGQIVARSLGHVSDTGDWHYIRTYGEKHYILSALLAIAGATKGWGDKNVANIKLRRHNKVKRELMVHSTRFIQCAYSLIPKDRTPYYSKGLKQWGYNVPNSYYSMFQFIEAEYWRPWIDLNPDHS